MKTEGAAHLLRIYINESDRWEGRPLYETIVRAAKEKGLAGATALRGIEGYGASGRVHSVKVLHLSEDVPIVVEIFDQPDRIAAFLPVLDKMVSEGAVTIEKVHVLTYRRALPDEELQLEGEIQFEAPEAATAAPVFTETEEFTDRAQRMLDSARESAAETRRVYADSIDVLLAMICEPRGIATRALRQLGIECETVQRALSDTVSRDENARAYLAELKRKSVDASRWLENEYIDAEHLLLALCQIRPTAATDTLTRLGAQPRDVCKEVLDILGRDGDWQRWLADHPDM
jgi:PII-like signaling protein